MTIPPTCTINFPYGNKTAFTEFVIPYGQNVMQLSGYTCYYWVKNTTEPNLLIILNAPSWIKSAKRYICIFVIQVI